MLLCDDRNPTFYCRHRTDPTETRGLMEYLTSLIPEDVRSRVEHVTVQEVIAAARSLGGYDLWVSEFEHKYGMAS